MSSAPAKRILVGLRAAIASAAFACMLAIPASLPASVIPLTVEEVAAVADEIQTIKVESTESFVYKGRVFTRANVRVLDSFKGSFTGTQTIEYPGGTVGPMRVVASPGVSLKSGTYAVVFLSYATSRMTEAEKSRFDMNSPMVRTPQFVGAHQGFFELKVDESTINKAIATSELDAVRRAVVGRVNTKVASRDGTARIVGYEEFANAVRSLVSEEKALKSAGMKRSIHGIRGEYAIADRDRENPVLRAFDPLPRLAYMTQKERAELQERLEADERKAAADARNAVTVQRPLPGPDAKYPQMARPAAPPIKRETKATAEEPAAPKAAE